MIKNLIGTFILMLAMNSITEAQNAYKYLALGDSYTIGEDVEYENIFPKQLMDYLEKSKLKTNTAISSKIIAKTGWTTKNLLDAMDVQLHENSSYDLVTLLIGVNNQYQKKPIAQYTQEFETLLQRAIKLAQNKPSNVIVVSIPDYGVTPFAAQKNPELIGKELDQYNDINRNFSIKYKTQYVDITPISRTADEDLTLIAKDQLHPSGKMYELWVKEIIKKLP